MRREATLRGQPAIQVRVGTDESPAEWLYELRLKVSVGAWVG